jgi:septal ring factor EnvC (AmiA/AmiB activator)
MKKRIVLAAAVTILSIIFLAGISFAQTSEDAKLQKRIQTIQKIIDQGISNGRITNDEAAKLQTKLDAIRAETEQFKTDGKLTVKERVRLHKELDKLKNQIGKKKYNKRKIKL